MTVQKHPERLLEIEDRLIADSDHQFRDRVLQQLVDTAQLTRQRLDRGLPPVEADRSKRMLQALFAAHQVVRAVWRYHHAGTA